MRYPPFRKTRLPRERKTIRVPANDRGSGREQIDHGLYYRCWNCGFVCKEGREALSDQGNGSLPENYTDDVFTPYQSGPESVLLTLDFGDVVLMEQDAAGDNKTIVQNYKAAGSGCPLCFTRAWRK